MVQADGAVGDEIGARPGGAKAWHAGAGTLRVRSRMSAPSPASTAVACDVRSNALSARAVIAHLSPARRAKCTPSSPTSRPTRGCSPSSRRRAWSRRPATSSRVEFRAQVVMPVRYVLDLTCDPAALTGRLDLRRGRRSSPARRAAGGSRPTGTAPPSTIAPRSTCSAPLPGFMLRKVTDGLVVGLAAHHVRVDRARGPARARRQPRQT